MAQTTISFEGVHFNKEWISGFKTEAEFLAAVNKKEKDEDGIPGSGYSHWFEGDPKRDEKLKDLYKLATTPEAPVKGTKYKSGKSVKK